MGYDNVDVCGTVARTLDLVIPRPYGAELIESQFACSQLTPKPVILLLVVIHSAGIGLPHIQQRFRHRCAAIPTHYAAANDQPVPRLVGARDGGSERGAGKIERPLVLRGRGNAAVPG